MDRTITVRLGTLLAILGLAAGGLGGYLVRRDVQNINQTEVRDQLAVIREQNAGLANEVAFARAYLRSLREWAIRISAKNGWPEPALPSDSMPPASELRPVGGLFWGNAYADSPRKDRGQTPR